MLRMADRILSQPLQILVRSRELERMDSSLQGEVRSSVERSQIIVADNVAAYVMESPEKLWGKKDFPYLIPPFRNTFIEYVVCSEILSPRFSQIGVLLVAHDHSDFEMGLLQEGVKWVVTGTMFATLNGQPVAFPDWVGFLIREDGSCIGTCGANEMWCPVMIPVLLAVSFMHCKGVRKTEEPKMNAPAKWLRRTKVSQLKYHVLEINPFKEVLRSEGGSESNGLKKALHICRGHFATYTEDKPLFGHTVGTVWRPSHVRGDIKHGAVVKDYSIKKCEG
jgi:hypothetical protein